MTKLRRSLSNKLLVVVALTALAYMSVAILVISTNGLDKLRHQHIELQKKLVLTVSSSAAIAMYANNEQIALEVLDSLLLHKEIKGARLVGVDGIEFEENKFTSNEQRYWQLARSFELISPVDDSVIGHILLHDDLEVIKQRTIDAILYQISFLFIQLAVVFIVLMVVVKKIVGTPLTELANTLSNVTPGHAEKLTTSAKNEGNEIGLVVRSINQFVESTNEAIQRETQLRMKLEDLEQHYRNMALIDGLTGLKNRLGCERFIRQLDAPYLAVLVIDLDGFKAINDEHGHSSGDVTLTVIAKRFLQVVGKKAEVGRMGGDEFAVFMPLEENDVDMLHTVASELIRVAAKDIELENHRQVAVGASVGISVGALSGIAIETIIHQADLAMYHVKEHGKNNFYFYDDLAMMSAQL
ncbi:GGDEF domain-containing protein [Vibrio sp. T187]|uniref:GGDEF domain-containing protein n=1 Tax=Vibrio TaxID=662 RepID=UPI0010CA0CC1|nr:MULTISPECIES: GGDEF domain-containing protein [Vibrio]MBW3694100.1 GGDEF domain-containing protein [Vibrio sp. T187]